MCMSQQETWMDLHHFCVAETLVAVPCWHLMFMTKRVCMCLCVCVLDKLVILSKFVTEKERISYAYTTAK